MREPILLPGWWRVFVLLAVAFVLAWALRPPFERASRWIFGTQWSAERDPLCIREGAPADCKPNMD